MLFQMLLMQMMKKQLKINNYEVKISNDEKYLIFLLIVSVIKLIVDDTKDATEAKEQNMIQVKEKHR